MHDCHTIKDELVDLAFDELSAERKLSLLVEIESCAECRSQYRETTEALYAVDEATTRARPGEAYWLAYDERLLNQLKRVQNERRTEQDERSVKSAPRLWKQLFAARLPVPYPVAAVVVLLLIVSTGITLRARRSDITTTAAVSPQTAETRIVEVPVVQEKVVTRTVYVERKGRTGRAAQTQSTATRAGEPRLAALEAREATTPLTRTGLAGFQPADDVRLTIIKAREEKKR